SVRIGIPLTMSVRGFSPRVQDGAWDSQPKARGGEMKNQSAEGSVRIEIANDFTEARPLQQRIVRELKATSFDGRDIFGIKVATQEGLINTICHRKRPLPPT